MVTDHPAQLPAGGDGGGDGRYRSGSGIGAVVVAGAVAAWADQDGGLRFSQSSARIDIVPGENPNRLEPSSIS